MSASLGPAVSGELIHVDGAAGRIGAYVDGDGPPMLLVHSVNAAASAAEVRPLHRHFRAHRTVFSIDLPGYGMSARSDRVYDPRLMTDALHAVIAHIRARFGGAPVDALALSLSCEFLARAAVESPASIATVALVSPTGFRGGQSLREAPGSTLGKPWLLRALRGPGWGRALFAGLTRPGVVLYFLRRTFGRREIDDALWRQAVASAHQPGAEHAPLHFLAGALFSTDIHTVYEQVTQPVWVSHGVRGDFTDYRGLGLVADRPNWRTTTYSTGALPYFEEPARFCADYERFLAGGPDPDREASPP
ncbi:MAG: alpha/beta fold hydrolase [Lautropia sp.]